MRKIGITGSLASGKTTASKILSKGKGRLFSADEVVKIQSVTTYILECMDEILKDLRVLYKVADKTF